MLHVPVALITEKLRAQNLEDDLKVPVPREGALQIEGKNVWLSLDAEGNQQLDRERTAAAAGAGTVGSPHHPSGTSPVLPHHHHHGSPTTAAGVHRPYVKNKPMHNRPVCDMGQATLLAPPKKKHCRSLSVPADTPPVGTGGASTSPQVEGARVWRPIPIAAMTTPANAAALQENRNLSSFAAPYHDARNFSSFTAVGGGCCGGCSGGCGSGGGGGSRFHRGDMKVVGHHPGGGGGVVGGGGGGCGCPTIPVAPSPISVDSGRDTTSDLQTPPGSPVPRPSSATSVRSHTSSSCFSSASWLDNSPARLRSEVLQSRSLSCEEQISTGLVAGSGSTPSVVGTGSGSVPLSPCRSKIPRCHSQPCVLHDRRCGKKRRRDADRPTLDFHKMTETAYPGKSTLSRSTPAQDIQKARWRSDMDHMYISGLMPIASSPRDTDLPATPQATDHAALSSNIDLDMAALTDLPSTPPVSDISSGIDIHEPVKLLGEEEEEEEEEELDEEGSNCGCHRNVEDGSELFPLTDLDLEEIESH